ncbi:MAG: YraN family protein [Rickettsiaceae bacterium]|nr:YraN family protein [Rickettsiaceae bacterium]
MRWYRIVSWQFKIHKFGEVDLIAIKGKKIVFIEVKYRKTILDLQLLVHNSQIRRIKLMSKIFLMKYPKYNDYDIRFDLAIVSLFKIKIIENSW